MHFSSEVMRMESFSCRRVCFYQLKYSNVSGYNSEHEAMHLVLWEFFSLMVMRIIERTFHLISSMDAYMTEFLEDGHNTFEI